MAKINREASFLDVIRDLRRRVRVLEQAPPGLYVYRDKLNGVAGPNGIDLGATPITNSLLLWKNGNLLEPGTAYVIDGPVHITLSIAPVGGDVYDIYYLSKQPNGGAASLVAG